VLSKAGEAAQLSATPAPPPPASATRGHASSRVAA
jgi:hypothetical protein